MEKRTRKRIIWAAAGVVVLALMVVAFLPKPVVVDTAKVERGELTVTLDAEGRTRVRDLYTVAAPVAGELERIALREGDRVARGAVLATLRPPAIDPAQERELDQRIVAARAAEREASAMVQRATSALAQAEREHARLKRLVSEGGVAQRDEDFAASAVEQARGDLSAARSRADAAAAQRAALEATRTSRGGGASIAIVSPADGQVLRIVEQNRRTVPAGTPIMAVGDPRGIEVVIDVLSSDATRVRPNDLVFFEGWGGDERLEGRVRTVEPSAYTKVSALGIEEQRVNVIAVLDRLPVGLGDGYRVDARIVLWSADSATTVPTSALFRDGEDWKVFVIREGRAHAVPVTVGHRNTHRAEVLRGLAPGDVVITHPSDQVAEGVRVETAEH